MNQEKASWLTNTEKYKKELSIGRKTKEKKMMNLENDDKKSRKFWTTEEIRYLRKHWGLKTVKELAEILGRTPIAIRLRASREGLLRKKKHRNRTKTAGAVQQNLDFNLQSKTKDVVKVSKNPVEVVRTVGNPKLKAKRIENPVNVNVKKESKITAIQVATLFVSLLTFLAVVSNLLLLVLNF